MYVVTFLSHYDWKGKIIIPFCSNEGSGLGKAVVKDGLLIHGADTQRLKTKIMNWAKCHLR